jgi:hypothetical protein
MLKKTITYTDFNDVEQTEEFYFNLSRTELTEMETSVDGGMTELLQKIVATENIKEMFNVFKTIILSSVGVKSEDGKRFVKTDQIAQDFVSSAAFDELFMSLATDPIKAAEFIKGIVPKDLSPQFDSGAPTLGVTRETTIAAIPSPEGISVEDSSTTQG